MIVNNINIIPKKSDTAFLTTIYPACMIFFEQFLRSLDLQSDKDFDLIIVNDGVVNLEKYFEKYKRINYAVIPSTNSIVENRKIGIDLIKRQKYKYLIFGDSDDYFDSKRVFVSKLNLASFDIVVNDLNLFDSGGVYKEKIFSQRLEDTLEIDLKFIEDKNIFGLTNTSVRVSSIKNMVLCESLVAFDWYLFSKLLYENNSAIFTNKTHTFYRQHKNNTVGLGDNSINSIKKSIHVKKIHYQCMRKIDNYFDVHLLQIKNFEENMSKIKFKKNINNTENLLWWENTLLIK